MRRNYSSRITKEKDVINVKENRGTLYVLSLDIMLHDIVVTGGIYIKLNDDSLWQLNTLYPSFNKAIDNACRKVNDNELTRQYEPLILCTNVFVKYIEEVSMEYTEVRNLKNVSPFMNEYSEHQIVKTLMSYYNAVDKIEKTYPGLKYYSLIRPDMAYFLATDKV